MLGSVAGRGTRGKVIWELMVDRGLLFQITVVEKTFLCCLIALRPVLNTICLFLSSLRL